MSYRYNQPEQQHQDKKLRDLVHLLLPCTDASIVTTTDLEHPPQYAKQPRVPRSDDHVNHYLICRRNGYLVGTTPNHNTLLGTNTPPLIPHKSPTCTIHDRLTGRNDTRPVTIHPDEPTPLPACSSASLVVVNKPPAGSELIKKPVASPVRRLTCLCLTYISPPCHAMPVLQQQQ